MIGEVCELCGITTITMKTHPAGELWPHRKMQVPLAQNVLLPYCAHCDESFISREEAKRIDEALEPSYQMMIEEKP